MCAGLNLGNAWLFSLSPGELIMEFDGSSGKAESWGQACDLCDLEFDRVRVAARVSGNVLATRQVRRSDFTSANQWQTFTLQFDNPCFGLFEARVWWAGNANMKFAQLTITPLEVATSGVQLLVTDQLGTPRMVFDKTGWLSGVSRHDYLPFGEELYASIGGRTSTEVYNTDNVRQHFTGYEADGETGLNFAQARYQSPVQGRFTSVDPLMASASVFDPQSLNRYSYVQNNPTNFTDPTGLMLSDIGVYQTANPEVADILENKMVELFRQAIRPPDPPSHSGGGEHHGGPQPSGGEHNHTEGAGPREHSGSPQGGLTHFNPPTPVSGAAGKHNTVVITYSDGTREVRAGGTRSWRNNNPGNIRSNTTLPGKIGAAGGFAIFSDGDTGYDNISANLRRENYQEMTVYEAIYAWTRRRIITTRSRTNIGYRN